MEIAHSRNGVPVRLTDERWRNIVFQSTTWLRLHPAYDPYRGDPRFNTLLARRARFEADGRR